MLTPDYLTHVSEGAEAIAARLHTDVTKRITRRIVARQNRGDDYLLTSADKWQIETLMDAGYLRDDIMKDIANATGLQLSEIRDAFEDAGIKSTGYDDRVYKAAGLDPLPFKQSPYMQRLMQRNYEATAGLWQNYTGTLADAAQQTFINAMDDIYTNVASGSMSYTQAYQEAIDDLAANGVDLLTEKGQKYVLYKSGHRDTIETAALRCVRTGVSQMAAQVTEARMDEMGVDLVIVSSHMGARPDHAVWQGGIYSLSGLDKKYPNFRESTGYGTGAGLCGWNCRHQFSPYFEGMDNPFPEIDEEENAEAYELTQQQRKMERTIRKIKRMAEVYADTAQAETDPQEKERYQNAADRAKELLKRQMEGYSAFCDKNDLRPLPERLRIARASRATGNTNLKQIEVNSKQEQAQRRPEERTLKRVTTDFTSAKTIDDAQTYAQRFVTGYKSKYSGNVSYKGASLDFANTANSVFDRVFASYEIEPLRNITPMNMRESRWKGTTADAAYQWIQGGDFFFNPKYFKGKKELEAHIAEGKALLQTVLEKAEDFINSGRARPEQVNYLKALLQSRRQCVAQTYDYIESTVAHECGHMLDDKILRKAMNAAGIDIEASMKKYASKISGYAVSSRNEYIAESFCAFWNGETDILDPEIVSIFEGMKKQ